MQQLDDEMQQTTPRSKDGGVEVPELCNPLRTPSDQLSCNSCSPDPILGVQTVSQIFQIEKLEHCLELDIQLNRSFRAASVTSKKKTCLKKARKRRTELIYGQCSPCFRHPRLSQSSKVRLEFLVPGPLPLEESSQQKACRERAQCVSTAFGAGWAQSSPNSTFWSNRQTGWSVELFPARRSLPLPLSFANCPIGLDWIGFKRQLVVRFCCRLYRLAVGD